MERRLVRLVAAGRAFGAAAEPSALHAAVADTLLELLPADATAVCRIDRDRGLLHVRHISGGPLPDGFAGTPIGRVHAVDAFPAIGLEPATAHPWSAALDDPEPDGRIHDLLREGGMFETVAVPVVTGREVWGQLLATRAAGAGRFGPAEVVVAEAVAAMAAGALHRFEDRERLRHLVYVDPLTDLANRRAVDDLLEDRFATAQLAAPVAALICDVDGLKAVNDERGHEAGDELLRHVGRLLARTAARRRATVAARLGGDEFCLLLEDVTEADLQTVTRELVEGAAALPGGTGLSCGWARVTSRPGEGTAASAARALLRMADAAQYRSKRASHDRRRATGTTATADTPPAELGRAASRRVLQALEDAPPDVDARLVTLAEVVASELHASGWVVGRLRHDGDVEVLASEPSRPGPVVRGQLGEASYRLHLAQGTEAERVAMALHGATEVVGATAQGADGSRWLVELSADAVSQRLGPHEGLLAALTELAVRAATTVWAVDRRTSAAG